MHISASLLESMCAFGVIICLLSLALMGVVPCLRS